MQTIGSFVLWWESVAAGEIHGMHSGLNAVAVCSFCSETCLNQQERGTADPCEIHPYKSYEFTNNYSLGTCLHLQKADMFAKSAEW